MRIRKINKKVIALVMVIAVIIPFLGDALGVFANPLSNLFNTNKTLSNSEVRILEIQPTNKFVIGDVSTGTGEIRRTINNQKVIVEHITMAEFIGKVDKINGKYDAIVIGRRIENSNNQYNFTDYNSMDNDITNRKANEIKDFIKTGQLVYIDTDINSLNQDTKVYKQFAEGRDSEIESHSNFIRTDVESGSFTLEKVIEDYNNKSNKRSILNITEYPQGDTGDGNGSEESRKLKYKFNITTGDDSGSSNTADVKLYLDINGDGLYKDEEIVDSHESLSLPNTDVELSHNLNKDFIGYLNWKIEVTDSNNVKSYITSSFKINRLSGLKKTIRVLQVMEYGNSNTSSSGSGGILNLQKNTKFQELIQETLDKYGYEIQIDSIGAGKFYSEDKANIIVNNSTKQLNGDYDMLIIGFKDWFDSSRITNEAIKEMIEFAKTGQGIMLTHDTIYYESGDLSTAYGSNRHNLAKQLADYIGQSRFENTHNISSENKDFTGKTIPRDPDKPDTWDYMEKMGATIWRRKYQIENSTSTKVYRTNNSLITSYPYELGETITIRRTHGQYLQLNFEDEDVVPWYNLTSVDTGSNGNNSSGRSSVNQYDSRNSYYTYSKGNITFSGTGETSRDNGDYPISELQLFINTIIKAERGANHAPTISSNITKSTDINKADLEVSTAQKTIDFQPLVEDIDNDKVDVKVTVEYKDDEGKTVTNTIYDEKSLTQGEKIDLTIDNPYYEKTDEEINGKIITIKVDAQDSKKASASVEYTIKPITEPTIGISYENTTGLVGDTIPLSISLEKLNLKDNKTIEDVQLTVSELSSTITGITKNQVVDVSDFNSENIAKYVYSNISTTIAGNHDIKLKVSYSIKKGSNIQEKEFEIIIRISSKEGKIILRTMDSVGNIIQNFVGEAKLTGNNGFNSEKAVYGLSGGRYTWPDTTSEKITASSYTLSLTPETDSNYTVETYEIKNYAGTIVSSGSENIASIGNITYDNPSAEVIYTIKRDKAVVTSNNKQLRILEIQPGNNFMITSKSSDETVKAGTEYIVNEDDDNIKNIVIDHIPMTEFIGKVDQLNGYYDVIVIGRESAGGSPYRDYSQIVDDGTESNYQENDITVRKSEEIKEFIETGQAVYIDKKIYDIKIKDSNLYKLFESTANDANKYDTLTLDAIIDEYEQNLSKRPIISVSSPIGDTSSHIKKSDDEVDVLGSLENRNMEFKISMSESNSSTYNVKLYLDIDGDGRYTADEIFKQQSNVNISSNSYSLTYDMPTDFVGQLNWKVEIESTSSSKIKSYITGEVNFRRLTENGKKTVRVLQIRPSSGIDLSTNETFNTLKNKVKDYNIIIETISTDDFNTRASSNYTGSNKIILNKNYDMVIIGFADVYGNKDIKDTTALDQIEEFIESGQGVMFTHDTMIYEEFNTTGKNSPQELRKRFRDYLGQARFIPLTDKGETKQTLTDGFYTTINGENIWGRTRKTQSDDKNATQVQQTNSALITDYPYDLSKYSSTTTGTIYEISANILEVSKTHTQHFQLNLEDPEVVPWYNIKDINIKDNYFGNNSYDSRNDYYTYSKGNITFSGTGHNTSGTYPKSELELFVNTIIKAERGANHAPVIKSTIPENPSQEDGQYDDEVHFKSDYKFTTSATDIDNDKVKITVQAYVQDHPESIRYEEEYGLMSQGTPVEVTIPHTAYDGDSEKIICIKIIAEDEHGAKSEKIYRILPSKNVQIDANVSVAKGLVGDTINSNIEIVESIEEQTSNSKDNIEINQIEILEYDEFLFKNVSLSGEGYNRCLSVRTTRETNGEQISLKINYTVKKTSREGYKIVNIPIYSKKAVINLNIDADDEFSSLLKVNLNKDGNKYSTINLNSPSYSWPGETSNYITTGSYSIDFDEDSLKVLDAEILESISEPILVNYENPVADIQVKITLGKNGSVISHGLLNLKSDTYTIETNSENTLNPNAIKGMYYRIGTEVEIGRNNSVLRVTVPTTEKVDTSKVELYEIEVSNENKTIKPISNKEDISTEGNTITASSLDKGKKYLLVYVAKFENDSDLLSELINQNSNKLLRIILQKESNNGEYLPELF